MVEIKRTSREFTKVEIYLMTLDSRIKSCKDIPDGTEIEISGWLEYTDTKDNGKSEDVFSIMSTDGSVYACTSKTFARNVLDISNLFDGEVFSVIKQSGTSKAGKSFIMASLAH